MKFFSISADHICPTGQQTKNTMIQNLTGDIVTYVLFDYLNLNDKINMMMTCSYYHDNVKILDLMESLSDTQIQNITNCVLVQDKYSILKSLSLRNNTNVTKIQHLDNLLYLDISCSLGGEKSNICNSELEKLQDIRFLDISNNDNITSFPSNKLECLVATNCNNEDLFCNILKCRNLKILDIFAYKQKYGLHIFEQLKKLEILSANFIIDDKDPATHNICHANDKYNMGLKLLISNVMDQSDKNLDFQCIEYMSCKKNCENNDTDYIEMISLANNDIRPDDYEFSVGESKTINHIIQNHDKLIKKILVNKCYKSIFEILDKYAFREPHFSGTFDLIPEDYSESILDRVRYYHLYIDREHYNYVTENHDHRKVYDEDDYYDDNYDDYEDDDYGYPDSPIDDDWYPDYDNPYSRD